MPSATDKNLDRIAMLLRQSERAATPAEAHAFAEKAQELISRHAIDEAVARARIVAIEQRATPVLRTVRIGPPRKRGLATYVKLFLAIAHANDVRCDIAHSSTTVYAFGFEADIDACEVVYTHLLAQMVQASNTYLRSNEHKSETRQVERYETDEWGCRRFVGYEDRPVHGSTARRSFQQGFTDEVGARLRKAREYAVAQAEQARLAERAHEAANSEPSESTELVLKAKEVEIADFYAQRSTARGRWRGFRVSATAGHSGNAVNAGRKAGQNARLSIHREIA